MKPVSSRSNVSSTEENNNQSQSRSQGSQNRSEGSDEHRPMGASSTASPDFGGISKTLSGYADQAKEIATDALSKAQGYGTDALDESSSFIRRYPGQTLAAGFGLGVLLGVALARR